MFVLDPLPYSYDALTPYIDAKTMEIHYTKHHQGYVTQLNNALVDFPHLLTVSTYDLLTQLTTLPASVQTAVQNHGGGHYNHTLFWMMMSGQPTSLQSGRLLTEIVKTFGSFEQFKTLFENAAKTRFGSGWAWLVVDRATGQLSVLSTANQDNPISFGKEVVLGLDVWEHAYYLHYQNRRADYVAAWWQVVNWNFVQERYDQIVRLI
jgi:Fe-Mn family superoxide dismutase